jgi:hypothetical protein
VDFTVGDFVLLSSLATTEKVDKLRPRWLGPYVVVAAVSDLVFKVQSLTSGEAKEVHAQHLRLYHDRSLVVTEQLRAFEAHAGTGEVIDAIVDHYVVDGVPEDTQLQVKWLSTGDGEGSWEPLDRIYRDAPALVNAYVKRVQDVVVRQRLVEQLATLRGGKASKSR